MLDRELIDLARRGIAVRLEERRERLRSDLEAIGNEYAAYGQGALIESWQRHCAEEVAARQHVVIEEFLGVLELVQAPYTDTLEGDLSREIEAALREWVPEVGARGVFREYVKRTGLPATAALEGMERAEERAREAARLAVTRFAVARRRAQARAGTPSDEDLIRELRRSGLAENDAIITKLATSAEALGGQTPNLNTCLTDARIALQTLAEAVAREIPSTKAPSASGWGPALVHLRQAGYLNPRVEAGLAGLYALVSEGAHRPLVGLTEVEMAALGRRMAVCACYFLIKLHNSTRGGAASGTPEAPA
jgi:hypothetical protein